MKITKVETIVVNMPMIIAGSVVPKQGGTPRTSMDTLLVRIDTDEGVTGWGEGFGHRIFTATQGRARLVYRSDVRGPRSNQHRDARRSIAAQPSPESAATDPRCMRCPQSTSRCGT
jgi:L-alanine-DL-glutamate epimerase-like enolase superfamily enzyme